MEKAILWFLLAGLLFCAEAASVSLICMWFGIGALAAMLVALAVDNVYIHFGVFIVVSLVMLCFLRPLAKKIITNIKEGTNVDSLVGRVVVLTEQCQGAQKGSTIMGDVVWSVVSQDGETVEKGQRARIVEVKGNKLVVEPMD